MIKFSVIIPVYNMESSIENTVKCFLNQTYSNYEIILIDDGSKDRSGRICDLLADKNEKIKVVHTNNQGSGPARNEGIKISTGDYIYFPDADDIVDTNAFKVLNGVLDDFKYDLIVFGYKSIDVSGKQIMIKRYANTHMLGKDVRNSYIDFFSMTSKYGIQGAPWNKLFKLELIKKYGIYFPPLRRHQDEAFIGLYVSHIDNVKFIENVLYSYYENDLNKEWDKYPIDYINSVIGLYEYRKKSILKWNSEDILTRNAVEMAYITGVIKSLELSFSTKYNFDRKQRIAWIMDLINKSNIKEMKISKEYYSMKYQRIILSLIKKDNINILYIILYMKVLIECKFKKLFKFLKKL